MRSMTDPEFGDVCDRISTGTITAKDEDYLRNLVRTSPNENNNELYKTGQMSIIVNTNARREKINNEKLDLLLPDNPEYVCESRDQSTNISNPPELGDDLNYTKTGNLQKSLRLKVGAPIMITVNSSKSKYREDGVNNGARAYIDSFQLAEDGSSTVRYIWIVFKDERIGQKLRNDNIHLLKIHTPKHPKAVPIEVCKIRFNIGTGNVSYQRTQFPAVLAYAVTTYRSQGDTLLEVIVDFTEEGGKEPFIKPGSFYVAISRATSKEGVFLKAFEKSYIQVSNKVVEKITAMRKFQNYNFKKIYLFDQIFNVPDKEIKVGYLNIRELKANLKTDYINNDKNLNHLDLLVIAETWLTWLDNDEDLSRTLDNFTIISRFDADDSMKHCGLLLLQSRKSRLDFSKSKITNLKKKKGNEVHLQGIKIMFNKLEFVFLYIRQTPTSSDIEKITTFCQQSSAILGDLNLNPRIPVEKRHLDNICGEGKYMALNETTSINNNNQLDHIIADKNLKPIVYATSYLNFISDHKAITLRLGIDGNELKKDFLQKKSYNDACNLSNVFQEEFKKTFPMQDKKLDSSINNQENRKRTADINIETHKSTSKKSNEPSPSKKLRKNRLSRKQRDSLNTKSVDIDDQVVGFNYGVTPDSGFIPQRRIVNKDATSCWLNSCLQMILCAMDASSSPIEFESRLGIQLVNLHKTNIRVNLDPSQIRRTLTEAEDERIKNRIEEIRLTYDDPEVQVRRIAWAESTRLRLGTGQQCVGDFLIALSQCRESWPDVYTYLNVTFKRILTCSNCRWLSAQNVNEELYIELDCPPNGSSLTEVIRINFNEGVPRRYNCRDGCGATRCLQKILLEDVTTTKFIMIKLTRTRQLPTGQLEIIRNDVSGVQNAVIVDSQGNEGTFNCISIVEHTGVLYQDGGSSGHYTADVYNNFTKSWWRTSDNERPVPLSIADVTKKGFIFLLKNVSC